MHISRNRRRARYPGVLMTWYITGDSKSEPISRREGTWNAKPTTTVTTITGEWGDFEYKSGVWYMMHWWGNAMDQRGRYGTRSGVEGYERDDNRAASVQQLQRRRRLSGHRLYSQICDGRHQSDGDANTDTPAAATPPKTYMGPYCPPQSIDLPHLCVSPIFDMGSTILRSSFLTYVITADID